MLSPHEPWPPDYVAEFAARQQRIRRIRADPVLRLGLKERYRNDPVAWINHWAVTYDPRVAGGDIPTTMPHRFEEQGGRGRSDAPASERRKSFRIKRASRFSRFVPRIAYQ